MKTDTAIRTEGMDALVEKLGYVDAERFIVLVNKEPFDYTKWRRDNLPEVNSAYELADKISAHMANKNN